MRRSIVLFSSLFLSAPALASDPQVSANWQSLTRGDVDAAYHLLLENHPGAAAETGDKAFVSRLEAAHNAALSRIPAVTGAEGEIATLAEFAHAMNDGHVWSNAVLLPRTIQWAGIFAAKRGADWVVAKDDVKITGSELAGARIVNCGGKPVDAFARDVLHFHTVVSVEAMEIMKGGWLLVDDGNPFLSRPQSCVLELNGKQRDVPLNWQKISREKFIGTVFKAPYGRAGFGVHAIGSGYWISLENLETEAQPVVDSAKAQGDAIRKSAFVVVDLRGNGGGDDAYGRALAETIYGEAYVRSILGPRGNEAGGCFPVFRASPGNIESVGADAVRFERTGEVEGAKEYKAAVTAMKAAAAQGHQLTGAAVCADAYTPAQAGTALSLMKGKVFVLTDVACFSSCINTVDFFRKLGAVQIGQITGADTHYSEVREITLPSGLATFSTLQAIQTDAAPAIGPFAPEYAFTGDMADTAALQNWVTATVLPQARR
ncbi:MAG TPA: S41 family peptidase [Rhizomicrobium sp.]